MAKKQVQAPKNGPVMVTKKGATKAVEEIPGWKTPESQPYMKRRIMELVANGDEATLKAVAKVLDQSKTITGYRYVCQELQRQINSSDEEGEE